MAERVAQLFGQAQALGATSERPGSPRIQRFAQPDEADDRWVLRVETDVRPRSGSVVVGERGLELNLRRHRVAPQQQGHRDHVVGLHAEDRVVVAVREAQHAIADRLALVDPHLGERCDGEPAQDRRRGWSTEYLAELAGAPIDGRDSEAPYPSVATSDAPSAALQACLAIVAVAARWQRLEQAQAHAAAG